jgi:RNA polymerase sigma-70 factor, ECF subfamily
VSDRLDYREEIEQWIDKYVDRLTRLAYTYMRDWAASEDAVQEAFIKVYQSRSQLRSENPFPWMARIVVNQCRMSLRKTWREVITDVLPERKNAGAEDVVLGKQETDVVHQSILALPESLRTPLYLYYFEDMSTKEIANVLGISDGAVRIRLTRARERLAAELKRREEDGCRGEATSCEVAIPSTHSR